VRRCVSAGLGEYSIAGADPEPTRVRLFDAVTTFFRNAASCRPLAIILDDLHRADDASLRLLEFLARELADTRLLVVGTYRDTEVGREHPLSVVLGEVAAQNQSIELQGLSEDDVGRLIEAHGGQAASPQLAAVLHARTEGNPLFVGEFVRLITSGADCDASERIAALLPRGVRDAIHLRCGHLSQDCQLVLSAAAVIGRDFDLDVLARVAGAEVLGSGPVPGFFAVLDEAVAAGLVSVVTGALGQCRFPHVLVPDTLYDDLASSKRIALHCQIGRALEELRGAQVESHLAVLAYHFGKATAGGLKEVTHKAIEYAVKAGERAAGQLAYEEAAAQYMAALHLLDSANLANERPHAIVRQRADLLIALGEAQGRAGEIPKARASLLEAARLARTQGVSDQLARAALGCTALGDVDASIDIESSSLLEEALAGLSADDSAQRVRLLGRLAAELYYSPASHERRRALSRQAVEMAERLGDASLLGIALCDTRSALLGPDNIEERGAIADRIIVLTEQSGSKERALDGHLWRLVDCSGMGDIAAVDMELHICAQRAEDLRRPFYLWRVAVLRAMRAHIEGRFDEADRLVHEALAAGQRAHSSNFFLIYALQVFQLRRDQGRLDEVEPTVREMADRYPTVPALRYGLASLYAELGREPEARAEFERLAAKNFGDLPRDANWTGALDKLAQVCVFLGDVERAAVLYEMLLPFAHHIVVISFGDACDGSASHALGVLATLLERWDDAAQHFENALAMNTALGARAQVARTQHAYAEMLLRRPSINAEIDGAKARQLLNHAIAGYHQLGMAHCLERASALRELAERQTEATTISPDRSPNIFRREGKKWLIGWAGQQAEIKNYSGVRLIALLLRSPHAPIHVVDLIAAADRSGESDSTAAFYAGLGTEALEAENLTMTRQRAPSVEPLLDARARADYARRLAELTDELKEVSERHDVGWVGRLTDEKEALIEQLRDAYGVLDPSDVMRKRVWKNLRQATAKIRRGLPGLADHLSQSIRTGAWCIYAPKSQVEWKL
jgi:tetratricopeptide (TPR) repeat protein